MLSCLLVFVIGAFVNYVNVPAAHAVSSDLVISHIIAGESVSSSSEFVAIYNNGLADIDMTGYCLTNKAAAKFACVSAEANTKVYVRSHNYLTIASAVFSANHGGYVPDTSYSVSNAIQVGSDTIGLIDNMGALTNQVSWTSSGVKPETNMIFQRKETSAGSGVKMNTGMLASDFESIAIAAAPALLNVPPNASYDVLTVVDSCPNIADVQQTMPIGYLSDENGNCQPDSCLNIPGLQISVPDHYDADASGNCVQHDECDNLAGIQTAIPANMIRANANDCAWDIVPLMLTEILPDAIGSDTGNEFIEIYNPTDRVIDLSLYNIKVGIDSTKPLAFPIGAMIGPGEYRSFSDSVMKFTLVNTAGRVVLTAVDGSQLGDTGIYNSPGAGKSWALIEGAWQYTNRPTPGAPNEPSVADETVDASDTSPAPCPSGKYRNPLTNRCRNIESDVAILATCNIDQYRNPETGRCRKIATTTLTPCKDNQYRSEETNRCRNIVAASTQKPCKDTQYRSEETGRCRNLPATTVPDAAFAVQPVKDAGVAFVGWWALGGVSLLAVGYGVWEWRDEIRRMIERIASNFSARQ